MKDLSPFLNYAVGSIVALNSHPFVTPLNMDNIIVEGEALSIPPLMIVIETLRDSKPKFDETSGQEIANGKEGNCKCLYYSHKKGTFESSWFSSRILKVIETASPVSANFSCPVGSSVILKTASTEIVKKKSSLKYSSNPKKDKENLITGILSFVSPVMQVVGSGTYDIKEPLFDSKTGEIKRKISQRTLKCKYYNNVADKFSEVFIPIEALELVESTSQDVLIKLEKAVSDRLVLNTELENQQFLRTMLRPQSICYKAGRYYLKSINLLENKIVELLIKNDFDQFKEVDEELDSLPRFTSRGKRLAIKAINVTTLKDLSNNHFWRIKYSDGQDNTTTRTIYDVEFYYLEETLEDEIVTVDYIKAKCLLRNGLERFFRIDRIQKLSVLNLAIEDTINLKLPIQPKVPAN